MIKKIIPGTQGNQFSPLRNIFLFQIPTDDCKSFDCHFLKFIFPHMERNGDATVRVIEQYTEGILTGKKHRRDE